MREAVGPLNSLIFLAVEAPLRPVRARPCVTAQPIPTALRLRGIFRELEGDCQLVRAQLGRR
jgi:hypothetical protein